MVKIAFYFYSESFELFIEGFQLYTFEFICFIQS